MTPTPPSTRGKIATHHRSNRWRIVRPSPRHRASRPSLARLVGQAAIRRGLRGIARSRLDRCFHPRISGGRPCRLLVDLANGRRPSPAACARDTAAGILGAVRAGPQDPHRPGRLSDRDRRLCAAGNHRVWRRALVVPPRPRLAADALAEKALTSSGAATDRSSSITISSHDGVKLAGTWYPAEEENTGRTALLLHGFAEASGALQAQRVAALHRAAWNVAVLDSRGYGRSGGLFASFGGRETGDVRVWLDSLAAQSGPACSFVPVLWGRSMGAAIAIRVAAEDARIRALILESPMVDLDLAMTSWFRNRRFPCAHLLARLVTRRGEAGGRLAHAASAARGRRSRLLSRDDCSWQRRHTRHEP